MQGVATVRIAELDGIHLTAGAYAAVILTATFASVRTAGISGAGMIMLSMVLTSVGLPIDGIAMIMGIDRIVDMCRTAMNVLGDAVYAMIVADKEGAFDRRVFEAGGLLEVQARLSRRGF
jgi:Na+/H+-dicarboxylate symporter